MQHQSRLVLRGCVVFAGIWAAFAVAAADDEAGRKYDLKYQFQPGETVRWHVEHRATIRTTVSGTTQTAETLSRSVKAWRVKEIDGAGQVRFEHVVESVDMRQKLTGRQEVRYNSQTDTTPPLGFENVAKSVGPVLSEITLDPRGKVIRRRQVTESQNSSEGQITIPLPGEPVPVGHSWSFGYDVDVPINGGGTKKIKTQQVFKLVSVKNDVATISAQTQILSPIHDPAIEAQVMQRAATGEVRFDLALGRILSQQMDVDKSVVGFSGAASSMHCLTRFTERLNTGAVSTALEPKPVAK